MKTKIFALLLAGVMGFSLASCGGTAKAPDSSDFAQTSEKAAVSDTEGSASAEEVTEPAQAPEQAEALRDRTRRRVRPRPRFRLKQKKKLRKRPGISTSSLPAMFTAA